MDTDRTLELLTEQKSVFLSAAEMLQDIEVAIKQSEDLSDYYKEFKALNAHMQRNNFLFLIRLRKEMFFSNEELKKDFSSKRYYWSSILGRDLDAESGKTYAEKYGIFSGSTFTGNMSEWNHSLVFTAQKLFLDITNGEYDSGIAFVSSRIVPIIKSSPLFMPIKEEDLVGVIEGIDIYEDKDLPEDRIFLVSPSGTVGFVIVKDLS